MLWLALAGWAAEPANLVLISLDTTRADALSCYGAVVGPTQGEPVVTPHLDAFAAEGVRFERFYATVPSTLSSHATMFTGLGPHGHKVVRNGYPLAASTPVLAERLRGEGYDTIGIVGAAALESAMGLDRGFRVYDDDAPQLKGIMYQDTADGVVRRTLSAVDARPEPQLPLFLFVHFYDPHTPYTPPEAFAERITDPSYAGGAVAEGDAFKAFAQLSRQGKAPPRDVQHMSELYLAEVAFVDDQFAVLMEGLAARGVLDHALVVVVADHGETLSDEPAYAWSHGNNVGHEVMWVPLLARGYGVPLAQRAVVKRQASMTGLAPTLERTLGLAPTLGTGRDFYELWRPGPVHDVDGWPDRPTQPAFMEATRPRAYEDKKNWNNLKLHRGVFAGGWGAWSAPFLNRSLVFYDRSATPNASMLRTLQGLLGRWDAEAPQHREGQMAPSTRRALEALGYLEPGD